tara:strand:- start:679 stop:882 length:204 start_codon:yes stop_codon:yes gene_type:complete
MRIAKLATIIAGFCYMPIRDELRLKFHCALLAKVLLEEMADAGSAKTWDSRDILIDFGLGNARDSCL